MCLDHVPIVLLEAVNKRPGGLMFDGDLLCFEAPGIQAPTS